MLMVLTRFAVQGLCDFSGVCSFPSVPRAFIEAPQTTKETSPRKILLTVLVIELLSVRRLGALGVEHELSEAQWDRIAAFALWRDAGGTGAELLWRIKG